MQSSDNANIDYHTRTSGGPMSQTLLSKPRQPALPSFGGLMGRNFTYRSAEKTDVRLTWQQAKEHQRHTSACDKDKP